MPAVKKRGAPDPLPAITKLWLPKYSEINSTTVKHVHNESVNFIEGHVFTIDINGPSNLIEMARVIGFVGMVTSTYIRYARDLWHQT